MGPDQRHSRRPQRWQLLADLRALPGHTAAGAGSAAFQTGNVALDVVVTQL